MSTGRSYFVLPLFDPIIEFSTISSEWCDHAATGPPGCRLIAGEDEGDVVVVMLVGFESLQYSLPATSLIIQSIPPSRPAPVTAEHEWIAHLCELMAGSSNPYRSACYLILCLGE
jgi:hypothetical protein